MEEKYYIVEIVGFEGKLDLLIQGEWNDGETYTDADRMYAVMEVDALGASIVDNGYGSVDEARQAWPEAIPPADKHLTQDGYAFVGHKRRMKS